MCRNCGAQGAYVEIGNQELIARRKDRPVPCPPGGTLGDYVPFYFTPYSPMLYNIKTGYGVPQQSMSDILILVSSLPFIASKDIQFVFSDRHAYLRTALFSNDLRELGSRIAWKALQERDFSKSDVDRFEKYQAEALVYKHVPLDALHAIMCHNDSAKAEVEKAAADKRIKIKVVSGPSWYL
jgi:ssDNA thymidine ADP-ribosyltransferase DarT-like protein